MAQRHTVPCSSKGTASPSMVSRKLKKTGSKAKKLPPFPAVHLVTSLWSFSFACLYAHFAYRAINHPSSSCASPPSACYRLPPAAADAAEASALLRALLWCGAPQAAAAALALLLPPGSRRRSRRALALAALAATAVNHGVLARLLGLLRVAAPQGDNDVLLLEVCAVVTCVALVTDLLGFLAILIGGREG